MLTFETVSGGLFVASQFTAGGERTVWSINWNFIYFSMTLATNSMCTLLIVFKILRVSGSRSKTYRGIIEILVESAALYSIAYIVYIGTLAKSAFYDPSGMNMSYAYVRSLLYAITVCQVHEYFFVRLVLIPFSVPVRASHPL